MEDLSLFLLDSIYWTLKKSLCSICSPSRVNSCLGWLDLVYANKAVMASGFTWDKNSDDHRKITQGNKNTHKAHNTLCDAGCEAWPRVEYRVFSKLQILQIWHLSTFCRDVRSAPQPIWIGQKITLIHLTPLTLFIHSLVCFTLRDQLHALLTNSR